MKAGLIRQLKAMESPPWLDGERLKRSSMIWGDRERCRPDPVRTSLWAISLTSFLPSQSRIITELRRFWPKLRGLLTGKLTVVANSANVNFFASMATWLGAICQVGLKAAILLDLRIQPLSHKGSGYATLTGDLGWEMTVFDWLMAEFRLTSPMTIALLQSYTWASAR